VSTPEASGVHQAPCGKATTPGRMRRVTRQATRTAPRSLKTLTRSPLRMPRASASAGWMASRRGKAALKEDTLSIVEWTVASVRTPMTCRGKAAASGPKGLSHSGMYLGTAGMSSGRFRSASRRE